MTNHPPTNHTNSFIWGKHALEYARAFADAFPGRGSATPAEAAAAEYVHQQLIALGVKDVQIQRFQGKRSIWLFLAQAFGLALAGHAAFWLLANPLGRYAALGVTIAVFALSFYLLWLKFTFHPLPAPEGSKQVAQRPSLTSQPSGASQNIIAVLPPKGVPQRRVVLLAHLDSHRGVWVFAHPLIVRGYSLLVPLALYGVLAAPFLYAFALLTGVPAFSWLALLLALLHFTAWFTGVTADLGPYSPGANDNASAVGSLLALAERFKDAPLQNTEVWLVFTGCEESGGDGMLQFLAEFGETLTEALFIDLELVGIGERLVFFESEGVLRRCTIAPSVRKLVTQAAQNIDSLVGGQIHPLRGSLRGAYTEMNIAWEHGFKGVCLMVLSSTEHGLPEWHRLTDTSRHYQPLAFELVQSFVWKLIQTLENQNVSL